MTDTQTGTLSVVVERDLAAPPEKVWRALTEPHLLQEWLMATDFAPALGHGFQFRGDWGSVDCRVLALEPNAELSYSWEAFGLESVVTWTLTPSGQGTRLRMEQSGFRPDQAHFHQGAQASWPALLSRLEEVLARMG